MTALPEQFINNMKVRLQDAYPAFEKSFDAPGVKAFHCNRFYNSAAECEALIVSDSELKAVKIDGLEACFLTASEHIGRSVLHHAGAIYSQDPSAMLPAGSLKLPADAKVLDLCAAPGGKSSQLAMQLKDASGLLIANEPVSSRNRILIQNMERMGYSNVLVSCMQPEELAVRFPSYFDVVLCDAPCSGEGMFRKYPESIGEWSPENVELCALRQRNILDNAVACLKPGGLLIYSTCTYEEAENEANVEYLLNGHPLSLSEAPEMISSRGLCTADGCYTFYPHLYEGEGQFVSYLRKSGEQAASPSGVKVTHNDHGIRQLLSELDESLCIDHELCIKDPKGNIRLIPAAASALALSGFTLPGIPVIDAAGSNKRLIPHHHFFKAAAGSFRYRLDISQRPDMALSYIKGLELDLSTLDMSGIPNKVFLPVIYKGYVLGGGRIDRSRLKNLYPKGLRYL